MYPTFQQIFINDPTVVSQLSPPVLTRALFPTPGWCYSRLPMWAPGKSQFLWYSLLPSLKHHSMEWQAPEHTCHGDPCMLGSCPLHEFHNTRFLLLPVWAPYLWPHSFLVYGTTNWPDLYLTLFFPRLILRSGLFRRSCEGLYLMTAGDHWRWSMTTQK